MNTCDYHKSHDSSYNDWVTIMLDTDVAPAYLEALLAISSDVMKAAFDARDTEMAVQSFDFSIKLIDTIHRINNEKKEVQ